MAQYPNLPNNRLIVNGIDLSMTYRLVMSDGYTLEPPEPKTYTIDIPGGDGVIDLTEALAGDSVFNNRHMQFTFYIVNVSDHQTFESVKTAVSNFLHNTADDFELTFDPGYTYHGRFSVTSYEHQKFPSGYLGAIVVDIDADPYKTKGVQSYKLNGMGGRLFRLLSGRKPVHPTVQCNQPFTVWFNGKQTAVPAGTYRINEVLFKAGYNDFYINTFRIYSLRWSDVGSGGKHRMTWNQISKYRWDNVHLLGANYEELPTSWESLSQYRWQDLATKKWSELNLSQSEGFDTTAYVTYDWKDL